MTRQKWTLSLGAAVGVVLGLLWASPALAQNKILRIPMTTNGPGTLDPIAGSTMYENRACSAVYETLLEYKYLKRPLELEPLLLAEMPEVLDGGRVWKFRLKEGVKFHDDGCFPGGKGREMNASDVIYSWRRLADPENTYKSWWLVDGLIKGFDYYKVHQARRVQIAANAGDLAGRSGADVVAALIEMDFKRAVKAAEEEFARLGREFTSQDREDIRASILAEFTPELRGDLEKEFDSKSAQQLRATRFDYRAGVSGMRVTGDYTFEIELNEANQQFVWRLAMFQFSIVPREAVEMYRTSFAAHPVGTGAFILKNESDWARNSSILFHKNPNYREVFFPSEMMPEDEAMGFKEAAGKRVPFIDQLEFTFYVETQPAWLEFKSGREDFTTVPAAGFEEAFSRRTKELSRAWSAKGIRSVKVPLLDFIFRQFNMDDALLGGYTPQKKALRQAFNLAMDWDENNETFYFGMALPYDGVIPPGLDGHPNDNPQHRMPFTTRGPDYAKAREKLREAGYKVNAQGKVEGLPVIEFYTSAGAESQRITELMQRNLEQVGIRMNPRYVNFTDLMTKVDLRQAPMFSFAWGSDYPDAENNLALFYGPNESPGSNHCNYKNPEYDALYRQIRTMPPGPERTEVYTRMNEMLIEDAPFCGSLARTRVYLIQPWCKYFKPTEDFYTYIKYVDIDMNHADRSN